MCCAAVAAVSAKYTDQLLDTTDVFEDWLTVLIHKNEKENEVYKKKYFKCTDAPSHRIGYAKVCLCYVLRVIVDVQVLQSSSTVALVHCLANLPDPGAVSLQWSASSNEFHTQTQQG